MTPLLFAIVFGAGIALFLTLSRKKPPGE